MNVFSLPNQIRAFYFYHFFSNLDFARGLFAIYLVSKGLSAAEIGMIQSILFIASLIFELPTGFIADKYGKKLSIGLGVIICTLVPVGQYLGTLFWHFAMCYILLGIGYSLTSGADTAILYNHLENAGSTWLSRFKIILGRARSFRYVGLAAAIYFGSIIQSFGWEWVFFSAAGGGLLALAVVFLLREPDGKTDFSERQAHTLPTWQELVIFFKSSKSRPTLFLILVTAFLQAALIPLFVYSQLMFKIIGFDNQAVGAIIAAGLLISSYSYSQAYKLRFKNFQKFFFLLTLTIFFVFVSFLFVSSKVMLVALYLVGQIAPSILSVHLSSLLNEDIPASIRATCLSLQSFTGAVMISLANITFGAIADQLSVRFALSCLAMLPLLSLITFGFYTRHKNAA